MEGDGITVNEEKTEAVKFCYLCCDPGVPIYGRKGCATHVREACRALQAAGHEVFLIATNPGEDYRGQGAIDFIPVKSFTSRKLGYDLRLLLDNVRIYREAARIVAERKPDVIYERYSLHSFVGQRLARRYGLPRVLEINAPMSLQNRGRMRLPWLADVTERKIFRGAGAYIVVSSPLRDRLVELGVPSRKIMVLPIAVDEGLFRSDVEAAPIREQLGLGERLIAGYVGALNYYQRVGMLFAVAKELEAARSDIVIVVVGGEDAKVEQMRERARKMGIDKRLLFLGNVAYEEVPAYIAALDIAVVTDTMVWSTPTKILEYAAMGKPVVAPDYPPERELLGELSGELLFAPRDARALTERIVRLAGDEALRKSCGEELKKLVLNRYTWKHYVGRVEAFLQDYLRGKI